MVGEQIRVLLIEDNPGDARLIQELLDETGGFSVECVHSLSTALERLPEGRTDVVLSDLSLPDCHGLDTFIRVRTQSPTVPVIVLSGLADETLAVAAVREGAQDYLVKGQVDAHLLQHSIRYAIERKRAEEQLRESEDRYSKLAESTLDLIFTVDMEGTFQSLNPAFETILGLPCSEWVGRNFASILHPDDLPSTIELFNEISQGGSLRLYEGRILSKSGDYLVMEIRTAAQTHDGKIVGFFGIARDITERKQVEQRLQQLYEQEKELRQRLAERTRQLEDAYQELCQLDQMKDSFLSTVSHELRTPLTSIKGFAEILLSYEEDKETQREFLTIINAESERLTRLINDLLDLSRIESGRMQWETEKLEISDVIQMAMNATRSLSAQKSLRLEVDLKPELPSFWGDKDRLVQVITNLLGNAIKFTPEEGEIRLGAQLVEADEADDPDMLRISVSDTGIGIEPEDYDKVFERFRQVGDTLTDKPKGTGLGLPICKEIVEHYGGKIWVESELGSGSTFFFTVPLGSGDEEEMAPTGGINEDMTVSPGKTVLVVDDEANIRRFLNHELTTRGHHVIEALSGQEAIDLARKHRPDLITLDVLMPDISGFDVTAVLKTDPDTRDIPILIVSVVEEKEKGYRLGANDYVTKPFDSKTLMERITRLLSGDKKKVLVVDDDRGIVKAISFELEKRGYAPNVAYDGEQALSAVRSNMPDLMVLDLVMPGTDGYMVIKELRSQPDTADLPIIVLTGLEIDGGRVKALSLGATDYLNKSHGLAKLFEEIEGMLLAPAPV